MPLFHDAGFWGFLTAVVGALRWLMKVWYSYRLRAARQQQSYSMELLRGLDSAVKEIRPVVEKHTQVIGNFQSVAQTVAEGETRIRHQLAQSNLILSDIKSQFISHREIVSKAEQTSIGLMNEITTVRSELSNIKTEILELKKGSGNVYVTTKKP